MNRVRVASLIGLLAASSAFAQSPGGSVTDTLPVDSKIRVGTLPNGLRYYIRKNTTPQKRAELRLAVNAGSILENNDQRGFAHIVEHTAFNGTTHFAKNNLIQYLQSVGARFGPDINAYTGFDETVYMLSVPTDTASIIENAFTILEDWAHGQVFDSAEVMSERFVVREEWRGRRGAGQRMLERWLPIAFKGSRYAERLPIGTDQSIMSATPSKLRAFYKDWYRPELMAVVAVGDFDVDAIEAQIKRHFEEIPRSSNPKPRTLYDVPSTKAPLIAITSDKEATSSSVELTYKIPSKDGPTVGHYRQSLLERLYLQMLNARLSEITQRPDAPFLSAGASKQRMFARTTDGFTLAARVRDGEIEPGLAGLLTESQRVDKHGFLQSELDRAKRNLLRRFERSFAEREKSTSDEYASELVGNFLEQDPIPGIAFEYELAQKLLPTISLGDVNTLAREWITDENRVIIVQMPDKSGLAPPTESAILGVFDRASKSDVAAYSETVGGEALMDKLPPAGKIVGERSITSIGGTEWKLSNGARVILKPTDFKDDEVLFTANSPGGTSLASDANYMSAAFSAQLASLGGVGPFNRIDLGKKLSGKAVSLAPAIRATTEGFDGRAAPKDLETLMQLVYLYFTAPRLDTTAFAAFHRQAEAFVANRGASPEAAFFDTVQVTMSQHSVRSRPTSAETLAEINTGKSFDFYRDRFADASDFLFVFVGNVQPATLKPLVEQYLATLPSSGRKEKAVVRGEGSPKGVIERTVRRGSEPKASTLIAFTGPCKYSPETRIALRALTALLQIKLTETLREQLGGTYSPSVSGGCSREPREEYTVQIQFGSSPENVETLRTATFRVIDEIKTSGPSAADVAKVKEQIFRAREVDVRQNSYWLSGIVSRDESGEDPGGLVANGAYDQTVRKTSAADIQASAKLYLNTSNYARFVLLPEH